jgi:dGTPase
VDPDVVEAACLAHDLGHPPFGHAGEEELDKRLTSVGVEDGFEGNAQTFRIVTKLALRREDFDGLNLTRATLNAILKYPWLKQNGRRKFGAYGAEEEDFKFARELCPGQSEGRSVEAELMDWADDVTYAVHDLEDFFRAGLIPLDRLFQGPNGAPNHEGIREVLGEFEQHVNLRNIGLPAPAQKLEDTLPNMAVLFPFDRPYTGNLRDRARLRGLTSQLISRYIAGLSVDVTGECPKLLRDKSHALEIEFLKWLTWRFVIECPSLEMQRLGQRTIVAYVFDTLSGTSRGGSFAAFPAPFTELLSRSDVQGRPRLVADFIASLSERQLLEVWRRLSGPGALLPIDPMLR